jgi:antitoxin component YwqK of YwqJK toxin-antitoxin module
MSDSSPDTPPAGFTGVWIREDRWGGRREFTYADGVREGHFRYILPNGVVQREGQCHEDEFHGTMITRDSTGQILDRSTFVNGTGVYRIFTSEGSLSWEIPLRRGKRHGLVRRRCGGIWTEEEWRDGGRVSSNPRDGTG